MLNTLLHGEVRGGKWHALIDKVYDRVNLFSSSERVLGKKGAAGVDGQTVDQFDAKQCVELDRLGEQLQSGTFRPAAVRRTWIPKPGNQEKRPLGIPTVSSKHT